MYSSIRVGRSVRSNCRSSSLGKVSFTRADIGSGGIGFSNSGKLLETASQNRFDCYVAAFAERAIDGFFGSGSLITEIEQSRQGVAANRIFGRDGDGFHY